MTAADASETDWCPGTCTVPGHAASQANRDIGNAVQDEDKACTFRFEAIGTQWEIETSAPLDPPLRKSIIERISVFDATYSRFRVDSLVSQIAAAANGGRFDFPDDAIPLFDLYDQLHKATGGAVDPLVGRSLELLGYDPTYSLMPAPAPVRATALAGGRATWSKDVVLEGTTLVTKRPLVIDVGAAGKGYLVDILAGILCDAGYTRFVVAGCGDLRRAGATATGQYGDLPSFVTVTVTLANGIITAVNVTPHATDPTFLGLESRFAEAVPAVVVGKPIDQVKVGRSAGSSGAPQGFNAAIQQIGKQAIRRTRLRTH